ncbi:MAG: hypothetical protein CSA34_07585 [Desulfobulbus propionicus]|nr:MAG: hypothetical protein CSA34_07585 [Desulfobulbus propionicus]
MKIGRYLLIGFMALLLGGCGTTIQQSLKVSPAAKSNVGAERRVVILPFADYSYGDDLESAYRRNLFVNENLTDQLVSHSFNLPVQEDVFLYLVDQNIINVVAYEESKTSSLENELKGGEWGPQMQRHLQKYIEMTNQRGVSNMPVLESPGTHGLTSQEVVKLGRHFSADYILRGRIIQYKDRQDPSWAPWKRGVLGFMTGVTNKIAFGQAAADKYDNLGYLVAGGTYGGLIGDGANWPYTHEADQTIFGVSGGTIGNQVVWGAIGAGLGHMSSQSGRIPQAVVQLRVWMQDAYNGDVVWTNRVDVKVSPESVLADYQYDALFETATEKAIATLIENFVTTL